jgi:outer membrane protein
MKKNMLMFLLLLSSFATFAQEKKTEKNENLKWKMRLRAIAVVPKSTSYSLPGADVKISTSVVPELDFTYFFTKNIAAELILGTTPHTVKLASAGTKTTLGKVWLLPPTLNLQYHFPTKTISPYVGLGINYTIFYGVKDDAAKLGYKNNVGFSTQLGMDYNLNDKWFLNLDIKKLFLKTDVTLKGTTPTVLKGVKIDPFVIGLGVGMKF